MRPDHHYWWVCVVAFFGFAVWTSPVARVNDDDERHHDIQVSIPGLVQVDVMRNAPPAPNAPDAKQNGGKRTAQKREPKED